MIKAALAIAVLVALLIGGVWASLKYCESKCEGDQVCQKACNETVADCIETFMEGLTVVGG